MSLKLLELSPQRWQSTQVVELECEGTAMRLCKLRDDALRQLGFADCFLDVKTAENEAALTVLPGVLEELDAIADPGEKLLALVQVCLSKCMCV